MKLILYLIQIILPGILSKIYYFNYINYNYILPKKLYIFIFYSMLIILYKVVNNIKKNLDDIYYFRLHILLNIIWLFLFFLYKNIYYSLIVILFNFIILVIMIKKYKVFYLYIYMVWFIYLVLINILIW